MPTQPENENGPDLPSAEDDPSNSDGGPDQVSRVRKGNRAAQVTRGTQLGIGQLMAITVGISIVCAVLATVLRSLPQEQQTRGSLFILVMVLVCLITLAVFYVLRGRAEKRAGASLFITRAPLSSWFHIFGIVSCVVTLLTMAFGLLSVSGNGIVSAALPVWEFAYFLWIFGAWSGKYLISTFLWKTNPGSIDVRTNGLILGEFMFLPYEQLNGFRWNKFTQDLMLLTDGNFLDRKVPASQRDLLERALKKFIPKKEAKS